MAIEDIEIVEQELLAFVRSNAGPLVEVNKNTPLFGPEGVMDSLSLLSLTLFMEKLLARELDPMEFSDPMVVSSVDNIVAKFWQDRR